MGADPAYFWEDETGTRHAWNFCGPPSASPALVEGERRIAKYRDPDKPGKWWLTDFTMEQVERRLASLERGQELLGKEGVGAELRGWLAGRKEARAAVAMLISAGSFEELDGLSKAHAVIRDLVPPAALAAPPISLEEQIAQLKDAASDLRARLEKLTLEQAAKDQENTNRGAALRLVVLYCAAGRYRLAWDAARAVLDGWGCVHHGKGRPPCAWCIAGVEDQPEPVRPISDKGTSDPPEAP